MQSSKKDELLSHFSVSPKEAIMLQNQLRERIRITPYGKKIKNVGGADVSMNRFAKHGYAGFVTLSFPILEMIDHNVVESEIVFPYIPGLLSFREIPMLLKAWGELKIKPDLLLVDGVGIAHPRRMGIATHLGLLLNIPTIGCAKNVLYGVYEEPPNVAGSFSYLVDPKTKEIIGAALRTKINVKPIFISPGNLITVDESINIVKKCILAHRLPEPTRYAHTIVNAYRIKNVSQK